MGQRILVFENNADFVQQLQAGFGKLGAEVDVAETADAGLERAKQAQPDLVLLSVDAMPAPGEAFLLCKKFKSDDTLKAVPFVIMGGEHHADAFESHKKLKKRRADEYLRLPIGFDDLIHHVQPLVPFESAGEAEDVDDEIDMFADSAFDDLMLEEGGGNDAETVTPGLQPAEVEAAMLGTAAASEPAAAPVAAPSEAPPSEAPPGLAVAASEAPASDPGESELVSDLRQEVARLEKRLSSAQRTSMRPPGAQSGVSSRDFLDLRETLNRKEKELLDLKDQISQRDKQLLEGNEKALALERVQADLEDRGVALSRDLEDANEQIDAYRADKESLAKRLEDTRGRLSRADEKLSKTEAELESVRSELGKELAQLKESHTTQIGELEDRAAGDLASLRADQAAKMEALETRLTDERDAAAAAHEQAIAEAQQQREAEVQELRSAHAAEIQTKTEAHAAEIHSKDEAHASASTELREQHEQQLAQQRADAAAAHEQALTEQKQQLEEAAAADKSATLAAKVEELEGIATREREQLEERQGKELAVLGRKLSEADSQLVTLREQFELLEQAKATTEGELREQLAGVQSDLETRTGERDRSQSELSQAAEKITGLESTLAEQRTSIGSLENRLSETDGRLERAIAKLEADAELLERVRKAMGIGLGLLEEQKNQPYEG